MWYFKDCVMEGGVIDFIVRVDGLMPKTACLLAHTGPASIWHDGSADRDSKTVLKNCFQRIRRL